MKQTAVQWLALKMMYLKMNPKEVFEFIGWLEEAKEIEKEQIKEAYKFGAGDLEIQYSDVGEINSEQYYNETYEKLCTEN
jgi:hypothetical protein